VRSAEIKRGSHRPQWLGRRQEDQRQKAPILVDPLGWLRHAMIHPADIQDWNGSILLGSALLGTYPFVEKPFADAGYRGATLRNGSVCLASKLKLSNAWITTKVLWCFHVGGGSNQSGPTALEG
jgi:hypothetical protein